MENLKEFCEVAQFVNHVNFSGMNFGETQILELMVILKACQFLLGVHLSNNEITKCNLNNGLNDFDYHKIFYDCTEQFGITEEDLIPINRAKRTKKGVFKDTDDNLIQ